jgi:hypothetical protein
MKQLIPYLFLLATLSACGNKESDPTPTDPFLGHWQAESVHKVSYEATGKTAIDTTETVNHQIDVTATTMTFTGVLNGQTYTHVYPYSRSGEVLTITVPTPEGETYYVRNLTTSTFTYEYNSVRVSGMPYYTFTVPYHR